MTGRFTVYMGLVRLNQDERCDFTFYFQILREHVSNFPPIGYPNVIKLNHIISESVAIDADKFTSVRFGLFRHRIEVERGWCPTRKSSPICLDSHMTGNFWQLLDGKL
jgi:hypothetical protein